jgi:DNA-binding transcriptional MerR regulator
MLSIGDLSRKTGVKAPTIRYYEQMGLIEEPDRTEGNQRRYGRDELRRLTFVRHARDLGLGINAIKELIALSAHPAKPCADADRIVRQHLDDVRRRIAQLKLLESELARISDCTHETIRECDVLRTLGDHDLCSHEHGEAHFSQSRRGPS